MEGFLVDLKKMPQTGHFFDTQHESKGLTALQVYPHLTVLWLLVSQP